MATQTTIKLAVSVALEDAGEATRSLALARALQIRCPAAYNLEITFLSHGSRFEPIIKAAGFSITACQPRVKGCGIAEDLKWDLPELVGSEDTAKDFIEGQLDILQKLRANVVLHGMWPFGSLAARILGIRTISFLPLPLHPACITSGLVRDIPDTVPLLTRLPRSVRQTLARMGGGFITWAPIFRQHRLGAAAAKCGWPTDGPLSLYECVQADITLVTDLPKFFAGSRLPDNFEITGPIFARDEDASHGRANDRLDMDILAHMQNDGRPAILLTMGSSGTKDMLLEAIHAFHMSGEVDSHGSMDYCNVLVLAPPSICSLEEAHAATAGNARILVTDLFVPSPTVNALADAVVCHGGQGTVQTAMAAGTPIVGVALQLEQQINLDHVMDSGAGIRIQRQHWRAPSIRCAIQTVLGDPAYKFHAAELAKEIKATDGAGRAAETMWKFLQR